jgi:hypothetical protein
LCFPAACNLVAEGKASWNQIQFCYDHSDLFGRYPKLVKEATGIATWKDISTVSELLKILYLSDWARLGNGQYAKLNGLLRSVRKDLEIEEIKSRVKAAILSGTGLIVKLRMLFPNTKLTYVSLCKQAARIVSCFLEDYLDIKDGSFTANIKDLSKTGAKSFEMELDGDEAWDVFEDLLSLEIAKPYRDEFLSVFQPVDMNRTIRWHNFYGVLIQGRILSILPKPLQVKARAEFIQDAQQNAAVSEEDLGQAKASLRSSLTQGRFPPVDDPSLYLDFKLQSTAGLTESHGDAGKLEEARKLLKILERNEIFPVIFDLETGERKGSQENYHIDTSKSSLFYIAIETALVLVGKIRPRHKIFIALAQMMIRMVLVIIQEPGKIRPLTKGHTLTYVLLAPMAAMLKECMACDRTHAAGLCGAEHAYMHEHKISLLEDSKQYFKNGTRNRDRFKHCFSDWKDASNWATRNLGIGLLEVAAEMFKLPTFYTDLCLSFCRTSWIVEDPEQQTTFEMKGMWPMGISLTKYVLHLTHEACAGTCEYGSAFKGILRHKAQICQERHKRFPRKECLKEANPALSRED